MGALVAVQNAINATVLQVGLEPACAARLICLTFGFAAVATSEGSR